MTLNDATLDQINKCRVAARLQAISARDAARVLGSERKRRDRDFDPIPFLMQLDDAELKKVLAQ